MTPTLFIDSIPLYLFPYFVQLNGKVEGKSEKGWERNQLLLKPYCVPGSERHIIKRGHACPSLSPGHCLITHFLQLQTVWSTCYLFPLYTPNTTCYKWKACLNNLSSPLVPSSIFFTVWTKICSLTLIGNFESHIIDPGTLDSASFILYSYVKTPTSSIWILLLHSLLSIGLLKNKQLTSSTIFPAAYWIILLRWLLSILR